MEMKAHMNGLVGFARHVGRARHTLWQLASVAAVLTTVGIGARGDACPLCGGYHLHITSGEELQLAELEIE